MKSMYFGSGNGVSREREVSKRPFGSFDDAVFERKFRHSQHSLEYTLAIDRITSRMASTDLRELLAIIPECFRDVKKIQLVIERNGCESRVINIDIEEDRLVLNESSEIDESRFLREVPLKLKNSNKERKIGQMIILSISPIRLGDTNPDDVYETQKVLEILGSLVARTIEAKLDGLTGLPRREYFDNALEETASESLREGTKCSLVVLDVDRFKQINDCHGHATGDLVLSIIAKILFNGVRGGSECLDRVFRIGGDEFAILLKESRITSIKIAERLNKLIREHRFGKLERVTCSFGVAEVHEVSDTDSPWKALFELADGRLLEGKKNGRDSIFPPAEDNKPAD